MRTREIAEAASTTPRTIRHYHQLGLLPVPPTVRGRRDYGIEHLARLLRIRWLVGTGLSLGQVAALLKADASGDDRQQILADLSATHASIRAEQQRLGKQATRIEQLIAQVEDGGPLSPLPTRLAGFYDALRERVLAAGGSTRGLDVEHQLVQVLAALRLIPPSAEAFIAALDHNDLDLAAGQVAAFTALPGLPADERDRQARALAERTWSLLVRHQEHVLAVARDLPTGHSGKTLWALLGRLAEVAYSDDSQRVFVAHLLELILDDPPLAAAIRRSAGTQEVRL